MTNPEPTPRTDAPDVPWTTAVDALRAARDAHGGPVPATAVLRHVPGPADLAGVVVALHDLAQHGRITASSDPGAGRTLYAPTEETP